jgi:serine palmitoyltransferase
MLDESISFSTVGRTGRGLTELYYVPVCVSHILLCRLPHRGFRRERPGLIRRILHWLAYHQRIKGTSFVFFVAVTALLAVSASESINILRNTPSILSTLPENTQKMCGRSGPRWAITILSHAASPNHPYPLTTCEAIVGCDHEAPGPNDPCSTRAAVVRYRGRGARAGFCGRGARAGRTVRITRAYCLCKQKLVEGRLSIRPATTASRSASALPVYEGACEAEMSALLLPELSSLYDRVILSCSSPYPMRAPVDHIYYRKYSCEASM